MWDLIPTSLLGFITSSGVLWIDIVTYTLNGLILACCVAIAIWLGVHFRKTVLRRRLMHRLLQAMTPS